MKKIVRGKERGRKKSLRLLSVMLCICLMITACPYMPGEISVQAAGTRQLSGNSRGVQAAEPHSSHCVCGGSVTTGGHSHDSSVSWKAWTNSRNLPTSADNYYLTQDINMSGSWSISADIKLCLNGHTVTCTDTSANSVIIKSGGSLSVCDCKNTGSLNLVNNYAEGGQSACGVYIGGTFSLYSGAITVKSDVKNGEDRALIGLWNSGKTCLYGGSITVTANQQSVTAVVNLSEGHIYGGTYTARGKESGTDYALNVRENTYLVGSPSFSPARVLLSKGEITKTKRITVKEGSLAYTGDTLNVIANSGYCGQAVGCLDDSTKPKFNVTSLNENYKVIKYLVIDGIEYIIVEVPNTVSYDANGGTGEMASQLFYLYGDDAKLTKAILSKNTFTKRGYKFGGWNTSSDGKGTPYGTDGVERVDYSNKLSLYGSGTTTLYAQWTAEVYDIYYKDAGDTSFSGTHGSAYPTEHTYGTATALVSPSKTGYTFGGWYTNKDCTGKPVTSLAAESYTAPVTLYAKWTAKPYTVSFNANGGTCNTASKTVSYGNTYGPLPTPTKTGYTFDGWYTSASGGTKIESTEKVLLTSNQTLYAHWTVGSYTVTYNKNSGTITNESNYTSYTYGKSLTLPTPTKTGYTFQGWYDDSSFAGTAVTEIPDGSTGNKTFYAKWKINTYTVTLNPGEGYTIEAVNSTSPVNYGGSYTFRVKAASGYDASNMKVKVNGSVVSLNAAGEYTISSISENKTVTVEGVADTKAPDITIKMADKTWVNRLLDSLTFGHFFKDSQTVTITAADAGSGVKKVWYYLANEGMTAESVKQITAWQEYKNSFPISADNSYVICVKAEDNAGNISFADSEGFVLDRTAPQITGITDGGVCCEGTKVTVTEANLAENGVTVNNTSVTLDADNSFLLELADNGQAVTKTITVTDKAGNESSKTVTVSAHSFGEWETTKAASCTVDGTKEHICSRCGKIETAAIPAIGHDLEKVEAQQLTCTQDGIAEHYRCKNCGTLFTDSEGKAETTLAVITTSHAGHEYKVAWKWAEAADDFTATATITCAHADSDWHCDFAETKTTGKADGDVKITSEVTRIADCEAAGERTHTASLVYNGVTYTCEEKKKETISATGHDWNEPVWTWGKNGDANTATAEFICKNDSKHKQILTGEVTYTVIKEATCTETGTKGYQAKVTWEGKDYTDNNEGGTETIPAKGHTMQKTEAGEPTCTEIGNKEYWTCSSCHKLFVDEQGNTETDSSQVTIPAIGHEYKVAWKWAETADDYTATATITCAHADSDWNCDFAETKTTGKADGDVKVTSEVTKAADCEAAGERTHTASLVYNGVTYTCEEKKKETISATGHGWNEPVWTWGKNGDTNTATAEFICKNDSKHKQILTGEVTYTVIKEATCTETGTKGWQAKVTWEGKDYTDNNGSATETIPAAGHTEVADVAKEPTCTETGLTEGKHCQICHTVITEQKTIPAAGHVFPAQWTVEKEATESKSGRQYKICEICGIKIYQTIEPAGTPVDPYAGKIEKEVEVLPGAPDTVLNNSKEELAESILTPKEIAEVDSGADAKIWLEVASDVDIAEEEKAQVQKVAEESAGAGAEVTYFDASLFKQVGNGEKTIIHEPCRAVSVTIVIPEDIRNKDVLMVRNYQIIRLHEGKTDIIEGTYNEESAEFTFETDKFSTYAICYKDSPKQTEPETPTPTPGGTAELETPTPTPGGTAEPETPAPVPDESGQTGNEIEKRKDLSILLAIGKQKGSTGIKLTWLNWKGASGYEVYWSYCDGKKNYKKLKTVKAKAKRTCTHKKRKKNRAYKYYIAAYKMVDGKKKYVAKSPVIHVAMKYEKRTNAKKITANKTKVILSLTNEKYKKICKLRVKVKKENSKKKFLTHAAELRYYTDDKTVATVSNTGKITAKGKGTCTVYVIANNGVCKKIKVTVK